MTLIEHMRAMGLQPPHTLPLGRFARFPGVNKGRSNRAGWCRVITPTLAVFGDWSLGLSETWRDDSHVDDDRSRRALAEAREAQRQLAVREARRQAQTAVRAADLIRQAAPALHPYLARKGFPDARGLVLDGKLLIPVRDVADYSRVMSLQEIGSDGDKKFLPGGRTRGGVFRLGATRDVQRIVLCEGYATGLSLDAALAKLGRPWAVIVCFSARNLELVAERFPRAVVAADHDASRTGEIAAKSTGLTWTMPDECGTDFNDMHAKHGLYAVVAKLREVLT